MIGTNLHPAEAKPRLGESHFARAGPSTQHLWNSPDGPPGSFQSWWVHVWAGLARDPTGKHRIAMGNSIWLYLYLLVGADRITGTVLRKQETIVSQTGLSDRTVTRQLQELREHGYITSTSNGRSLRIVITKWRPARAAARPQNKT